MKLAIIGGAGVRVPLLVNGLVGRGLPIDEIALFDVDAERLAAIRQLSARRAPAARVTTCERVREAVRAADFVVTSIRVGGLAARRRDETVSLAHGVIGQETVGPGGFAMAVRTIPVLRDYVRDIAQWAPDAWVINFSNPVGIVTQAMRAVADLKIVGICDTPTELFAEVAHALGVPAADCAFDYVGLNHLGWLRDVRRQGRSLLEGLWSDAARLGRIYTRPLFPAEYLAALQLLPTEYVYYYAFPERAVANIRHAGTSRGAVVSALTDELFASLIRAPGDAVRIYEDYIAARSASYMQIESGQLAPTPPSPWAELTGYDRIAYDVMHAIVHDTHAVIPLNVPNRGNIPDLEATDEIEVPCVVGSNGPRALHAGALPAQVRELTVRVKDYERRTVSAALTRGRDALVDALAHNPLVASDALAAELVDALGVLRS